MRFWMVLLEVCITNFRVLFYSPRRREFLCPWHWFLIDVHVIRNCVRKFVLLQFRLEVNLRHPLHAGEGSTLSLEPRANVTRSPKHGVSVASQKGLMSPKFLWKRFSFFEIQSLSTIHQPSWFEPMHCLHRSPTQMKAIVWLLKSSHVYAPLPSVKCAQFNEDVSSKGEVDCQQTNICPEKHGKAR